MARIPAKRWKVALWSLVATCLGVIPGLGMPGAVMIAIASLALLPLMPFLPFLDPMSWPADAWWPAAILLTFTSFPFLVLAHELSFRRWNAPRMKQWAAWFGLLVAWSCVGYAVVSAMAANGL